MDNKLVFFDAYFYGFLPVLQLNHFCFKVDLFEYCKQNSFSYFTKNELGV